MGHITVQFSDKKYDPVYLNNLGILPRVGEILTFQPMSFVPEIPYAGSYQITRVEHKFMSDGDRHTISGKHVCNADDILIIVKEVIHNPS